MFALILIIHTFSSLVITSVSLDCNFFKNFSIFIVHVEWKCCVDEWRYFFRLKVGGKLKGGRGEQHEKSKHNVEGDHSETIELQCLHFAALYLPLSLQTHTFRISSYCFLCTFHCFCRQANEWASMCDIELILIVMSHRNVS
jgi:hypothetical protein